jgi:hypothetical protein
MGFDAIALVNNQRVKPELAEKTEGYVNGVLKVG